MKINLIIDGNYLMQKSVFILYKLRNLYTDLPIILDKDFNTITNLYYFNKIYFVSDSRGNWRKNFYEQYKGTRKKNEKIEWKTVYELFNKFKYEIKNKKCEIYQIDNLEADDIISYIVKESNKKGYSNMIIANDSDLYQLLHYDIVSKYINFMYNFKFNDERVFLPSSYQLFIDEVESSVGIDDMFGGEGGDDLDFINFIKGLTTTKKVIDVDSEKELFIKIIGHNKDNIKSIYMKGNRGIGKVGAERIYNFYKDTYPEIIDFNSDVFKDRVIESVKYYKHLNGNSDVDHEMRKRLNVNLKLVKLDQRSIPNNLYEKMQEKIKV